MVARGAAHAAQGSRTWLHCSTEPKRASGVVTSGAAPRAAPPLLPFPLVPNRTRPRNAPSGKESGAVWGGIKWWSVGDQGGHEPWLRATGHAQGRLPARSTAGTSQQYCQRCRSSAARWRAPLPRHAGSGQQGGQALRPEACPPAHRARPGCSPRLEAVSGKCASGTGTVGGKASGSR